LITFLPGEKPYSCDACGKSFKTKGELNIHVQTHSNGLRCPVCGETINGKKRFEQHVQRHYEVCGIVKTSKKTMQNHLKTHTVAERELAGLIE